ncbi:MAG: sulfatase family protein [Planctomycetota bacterium]
MNEPRTNRVTRALARPALRMTLIAAAGALLAAAVVPSDGDQADTRIQRVVVLHLDTTRFDDLGCNGGVARTPNIDGVAARGMRYENSIVTSPKTSPSIATFLTGRVPNRHGVYDVGAALDEKLTTVAEILQARGFVTAGFTSNPIVGQVGTNARRSAGFDQGFDVYETHYQVATTPEGQEPNATPRAHAPLLVDRALQFVERHQDDRFFLWMLHLDPHTPYAPPEPWETMYLDDPEVGSSSERLNPAIIHHSAYVRDRLHSHEYVARHLGEVSMVDHELGRLLQRLGSLPGRTLLVITADHGESLGDVGYWFDHGRNLRHPCLNVPLIIACEGLVPIGTSRALVANIDLSPTILDLLGIQVQELNGNGRSLVPTFTKADPWPNRMIPIQTYRGQTRRGVRSSGCCLQSRYAAVTGAHVRSLFFDLERDPGETVDVSAEFAEAFEAHLQLEREWFARPAWTAAEVHDPEMVRQLRSLGYVR